LCKRLKLKTAENFGSQRFFVGPTAGASLKQRSCFSIYKIILLYALSTPRIFITLPKEESDIIFPSAPDLSIFSEISTE
jgi:hypothetical protein